MKIIIVIIFGPYRPALRYSDFFSFKKVFIILKSLILYHFHNPRHQCQYQTNTSLKRERKKPQPH